MPLPDDAERYLQAVRRGLSELDPDDQDEIVEELRSHLLDRRAEGREDILEGFESPDDLAANFVSDHALRGALVTGTSWALGRAIWAATRDNLIPIVLLLPLTIGHIVAFGCVITAVLKPFRPHDMGLWVGDGNFHVGSGSEKPGVHEVLGWWGIPILMGTGIFLFWISNRILRVLAQRQLRRMTGHRA